MRPPAVVPWSYSSLSSYESCPKRFNLVKITKEVTERAHAANDWGNQVHKALELAVKDGAPLQTGFTQYAPLVKKIRDTEGRKFTEQRFGITKAFQPTEFFAKDVWFRGVLDLQIVRPTVAHTWDYKTGKVKTDGDQLKLFAAATFAQHPYVEKVKTAYLWLQHNKISAETYTKEDVPIIWQEFLPRVRRMEIALEKNNWPPNPSGLCGWCPVGRSRCGFWKGYAGENR